MLLNPRLVCRGTTFLCLVVHLLPAPFAAPANSPHARGHQNPVQLLTQDRFPTTSRRGTAGGSLSPPPRAKSVTVFPWPGSSLEKELGSLSAATLGPAARGFELSNDRSMSTALQIAEEIGVCVEDQVRELDVRLEREGAGGGAPAVVDRVIFLRRRDDHADHCFDQGQEKWDCGRTCPRTTRRTQEDHAAVADHGGGTTSVVGGEVGRADARIVGPPFATAKGVVPLLPATGRRPRAVSLADEVQTKAPSAEAEAESTKRKSDPGPVTGNVLPTTPFHRGLLVDTACWPSSLVLHSMLAQTPHTTPTPAEREPCSSTSPCSSSFETSSSDVSPTRLRPTPLRLAGPIVRRSKTNKIRPSDEDSSTDEPKPIGFGSSVEESSKQSKDVLVPRPPGADPPWWSRPLVVMVSTPTARGVLDQTAGGAVRASRDSTPLPKSTPQPPRSTAEPTTASVPPAAPAPSSAPHRDDHDHDPPTRIAGPVATTTTTPIAQQEPVELIKTYGRLENASFRPWLHPAWLHSGRTTPPFGPEGQGGTTQPGGGVKLLFLDIDGVLNQHEIHPWRKVQAASADETISQPILDRWNHIALLTTNPDFDNYPEDKYLSKEELDFARREKHPVCFLPRVPFPDVVHGHGMDFATGDRDRDFGGQPRTTGEGQGGPRRQEEDLFPVDYSELRWRLSARRVLLLADIVRQTPGLAIVLSSTWRLGDTDAFPHCRKMWGENGQAAHPCSYRLWRDGLQAVFRDLVLKHRENWQLEFPLAQDGLPILPIVGRTAEFGLRLPRDEDSSGADDDTSTFRRNGFSGASSSRGREKIGPPPSDFTRVTHDSRYLPYLNWMRAREIIEFLGREVFALNPDDRLHRDLWRHVGAPAGAAGGAPGAPARNRDGAAGAGPAGITSRAGRTGRFSSEEGAEFQKFLSDPVQAEFCRREFRRDRVRWVALDDLPGLGTQLERAKKNFGEGAVVATESHRGLTREVADEVVRAFAN